jgi:signal transduction histidine kinase
MDISALVGEVLRGFDRQLCDLQFAVDVAIAPDLPPIRGDRTALRLAFDNVVDNAIRYSADVRSLTVTATAVDGCVRVDIADSGVGIPAEELSLVTRRFFRGRGARATGSGLGLPIAHRIVSDHDGTVTVTSEAGRGTTVRFTLPQARSGHAKANSGHRG